MNTCLRKENWVESEKGLSHGRVLKDTMRDQPEMIARVVSDDSTFRYWLIVARRKGSKKIFSQIQIDFLMRKKESIWKFDKIEWQDWMV